MVCPWNHFRFALDWGGVLKNGKLRHTADAQAGLVFDIVTYPYHGTTFDLDWGRV
jgi:hypothetical protein